MNDQHLNCPNCHTPIEFNVIDLLFGLDCTCPECATEITFTHEPSLMDAAIEDVEKVKRSI